MIDPDQFLAMELASGKAEVVMDEDLTSLSWLQSKNVLKGASPTGLGGRQVAVVLCWGSSYNFMVVMQQWCVCWMLDPIAA